MPEKKRVIGLDFDNTLVSYDKVMYQTAQAMGFIKAAERGLNKTKIRDRIRTLPAGELKWQKLQAEVYGKRMDKAQLIKGVEKFLKACREEGIKTFIVSHKSRYAAQDTEKAHNLQEAALRWMRQQGFFDQDGLGLHQAHVYFEDTRQAKAARITELKCTHFVDDLQEVFLEKTFPRATKRLLLSSDITVMDGVKVFSSWEEIYNYFFKNNQLEELRGA
jgi:hypothetical protein